MESPVFVKNPPLITSLSADCLSDNRSAFVSICILRSWDGRAFPEVPSMIDIYTPPVIMSCLLRQSLSLLDNLYTYILSRLCGISSAAAKTAPIHMMELKESPFPKPDGTGLIMNRLN